MRIHSLQTIGIVLTLTVLVVAAEAQPGPARQRKRDGSCTQPARDTRGVAAQPSAGTFSSPQQRGQRQGWRGGGGCWGSCWQNAASASAPSTRPASRIPESGETPQFGRGFGPPIRMRTIHALLNDHLQIRRTVQDIPGGVDATTTSPNPLVAELLQTHVAQMQRDLREGRPIRMWDPLFVKLFEARDKIELQVEELPNGVRIHEVSNDPEVTKLIRQHAHRGVSEFAKEGWERVHKSTPLPQ